MPSPHGAIVCWLAAGALLAVAAGGVAAHLSGRVKLIGLFAVAFGVLCGWGQRELAGRLGVRRARPVTVLGALLVLAGLLVFSGESFRLYRLDRAREFAGNPVGLAAAQMQARGGVPPEVAEEFARAARARRAKLAEESRFSAFAAYRIRQFAAWPAPWPVVFWGGEVLLGTAAGAWILARGGRESV